MVTRPWHVGRGISTRAANILSALDIAVDKEVPGVYDGVWKGTGDVLESVCPTTGEVLARVQSVSTSMSMRVIRVAG